MNIGRGSGTTAGREPVLRRQLVSTSYSPYTLWKYFLCTAVSLNSDFHCCAVSKHPEKPFLLLHRGQSAKFDVIFKPTLAQHLEGRIRVLVGNTCSNKTQIELVGEGHEDEFTLDGLEEDTKERNAKSSLKKDIIDGKRGEAAKLEQGRGKCLIMCVPLSSQAWLSPTGLGGLWVLQPCMQSSVCCAACRWLKDVSGCFPESGGMGNCLGNSVPEGGRLGARKH